MQAKVKPPAVDPARGPCPNRAQRRGKITPRREEPIPPTRWTQPHATTRRPKEPEAAAKHCNAQPPGREIEPARRPKGYIKREM